MNKAELTDKLSERTGLSARDARAAMDAIFDPDPAIGLIAAALVQGDKVAVSIHVYGANIGAVRRHVYDPTTGKPKEFVSGYHNSAVPNLWDRAKE